MFSCVNVDVCSCVSIMSNLLLKSLMVVGPMDSSCVKMPVLAVAYWRLWIPLLLMVTVL